MTNVIFPEEPISIYPNDKPYFTQQLRIIKRRRCREYAKNGKSEKYRGLCIRFEDMLKSEIAKYKCKLEEKMKNYQKGSIYPFLRKLGNGPNDLKHKPFVLPSHSDMSPLECAEDIAPYFSSISQ